ncbi:hypothetical protein EL84_26355 [Paenibacillus sp. VT-400]|uniref:hypothetical protein n=1 Tax=Paenibacillus sp. VT-400 TaxID=1495853 RepID=UPI000649943B|nr:hypothetical protein [Paenibacillus sp. VT-400]KLU55562.1 hypothetical protein EL84_26355 [Paenibacillus sp. VT-400]
MLNRQLEDDYIEKYYSFKERHKDRTLDELKILKTKTETKESGNSVLPLMVGILSAGLIVSLGSAIYKSGYQSFLESHDIKKFIQGVGPTILIVLLGILVLYSLLGYIISKSTNEKLFFARIIEDRELELENGKKIIENRQQQLKRRIRKTTI